MLLGRVGLAWVALQGGRLFAAEPVTPATRAPEPDRVRISFSAPPSCPDKATFLAQIASRVTISWLADDTELARQIKVTLAPSSAGFSGHMEYVDESGRTVTRSLEAPDCAQATAGIALVTAIAVESQAAQPVPLHARSLAQPEPAPPDQASATLATAAPGDAERSSSDRASAQATAIAPSPSSRSRDRAPDATRSRANTDRHEVGVVAGGMQGVGPGIALGGAVLWGFGKPPFPWLRASARWYETHDEAGAGSAMTTHFRVIAAGPQACAGQVLAGPVTQGLCAGIEIGQYSAEGEAAAASPYEPRSHHLLWAAAEASLPLRLAGSSVFVELEPAVRFPLVSGTFELQNPDQPVYEIPRVAVALNLATGVTFR